MARKSIPLTLFGKYLEDALVHASTPEKPVTRQDVAKALDITVSYVSMLCRGPTKPGLRLALEIQRWTRETFPFGPGFEVSLWA